jgi:hypothetical protein
VLKKIFEARIELATSSVLDWRDNQLHHPNFLWMAQLGLGLINPDDLANTWRPSEVV